MSLDAAVKSPATSVFLVAAILGFSLGLLGARLFELPPSHSIKNVWTPPHNISCPACKCQLGPLQCPPCQCNCITTLNRSALGLTGPTSPPPPFCPWDSNFSVFYSPDKVIDLGGQQRICVDAIVYGYDRLFEEDALYRKTKWLGVPNQQDPTDAMIFQEVLWKHKPDVVIELGTNVGGGTLFYASIMSFYSKTARVITVDPKHYSQDWYQGDKRCAEDYPCLAADTNSIWKERVTFIQGLPTQPDIIAKVQAEIDRVGAKKIIVVEDSSHMYDHVMDNARAYSKFVTPGLYMIIQDSKMTRFYKQGECGQKATQEERETCYKNFRKAGPADAITDFLAENQEFSSDRSWEFLYYTQHARGFLKRRV